MSIPPSVGYVLLAAFGVGLLAPLALAAKGQSDRAGAITGICVGTVFSVPAGLLTGTIFWSMLEEAAGMPGELVLILGPLIGCFAGTYAVALITRETGASAAAAWKRRSI